MNKETLEKGNDLQKEINELARHIDHVENKNSSHRMMALYQQHEAAVPLRNNFIPMTREKFVLLYIMSCKIELEKLNEEFKNLKDE